MKRLATVLFTLLVFVPVACSAPASPTTLPTPSTVRTLTVMAASSLTEAFRDLGAQFEKTRPGVTVQFNFAGSQQLALQLTQGARADVFASADTRSMDAAKDAQGGAPRLFARNRLTVIVPAKNPAGLQRLGDLARAGLKLDMAAASVPVGQYTLDMLDKASADAQFGPTFKAAVLKNVVSYETNVKQVVTKVELGEVDGGIVYTTDAAASKSAARIEIPDALNVIASYPVVAVKNAAQPDLAAQWVDWLLTPAAQSVLQSYGFVSPADSR